MTRDEANLAFVKKAQKALGVTVDGFAGDKTTEALFKALGLSEETETVPAQKPLDARSEERMVGVDAKLVNVVRRAAQLCPVPFMVIEGLRTKARQQELYAQGRTKPGPVVTWTLKSKHIDGKAVDLAPVVNGKIEWNDSAKFRAIAEAMYSTAKELGVPIRWGGNWDGDDRPGEKGETDGPHFELAS